MRTRGFLRGGRLRCRFGRISIAAMSRKASLCPILLLGATLTPAAPAEPPHAAKADPAEVLAGVKRFFERSARADGSFQPATDPGYRGMSDSAYSDLAPAAYAVVVSRTFGWKLPHEEKTKQLLLGRQRASGEFVNAAGTVDPASPAGRAYNTTMALMALRALGA